MNTHDSNLVERLQSERMAVETLYRAFGEKNPNLVDGRVTTTWHMEDWFGLFLQLGQFPQQA